MILYLLVHIFILANMTVGELSRVDRNQTFNGSITQNSTMKSGDAMSSLNKDEKRQIEDELENNQTSAVIREDDESFQEQEIEFPARHCLQDVLIVYSHSHCGAAFRQEMLSISTENWCVLENIIRPYNDMTMCLEKLSNLVGCYYPNSDIQDFFLEIHSQFFQNCSTEELLLVDAPQGLVIVLTLIPVSIIPVLVYLVVWKSKV